jgi:hypothetical protein
MEIIEENKYRLDETNSGSRKLVCKNWNLKEKPG